jgi:hypothetical protein
MKYSVGDVIYVPVAFEDGTGTKPRPVIILRQIPEKLRYVVAECYSDKEHYDKNFGVLLIKENTQIYNEMGLTCDTFITSSVKAVFEIYVIKKLGVYKNIASLMDRIRMKR